LLTHLTLAASSASAAEAARKRDAESDRKQEDAGSKLDAVRAEIKASGGQKWVDQAFQGPVRYARRLRVRERERERERYAGSPYESVQQNPFICIQIKTVWSITQ
jgi:hypothetical protein